MVCRPNRNPPSTRTAAVVGESLHSYLSLQMLTDRWRPVLSVADIYGSSALIVRRRGGDGR
jgi:hypothetical protein